MEWGAAVAAFFTALLAVLKWWQSRQPQRDQEQSYDETQQGRADIANGDADAVSVRADRLLTGSSDTAGQSDRVDRIRQFNAVLGLADSGRSAGEDFGKSGSMPETKTVTGVILDSEQKVK